MIKLVFYAAVLTAVVYGLFIKELGGKTLAAHVSEVWTSDLVQRKVDSLKADVRQDLEARLAKVTAEKAAKGVSASSIATQGKRDGHDYINDDDRESLSALIEKKTR